MGFLVEKEDPVTQEIVKEYEPSVMWNLEVKSYISAPPDVWGYRAYQCKVNMDGGPSFHYIIDDAYPHKILVASKFTASGLRGLLKLCLPPYTATSPMRRKQQQMAIIGAIGNLISIG